jgi:hypothetical protein
MEEQCTQFAKELAGYHDNAEDLWLVY